MVERVLVGEVMTREVATLTGNDPLRIADDVMRLGRIRHLPVVDEDGKLEGIVSQRDLFRGALARALGYGEHAQSRILSLLNVKEVMSVRVHTVTEETPLVDAAQRMIKHKIGCLVVVKGDQPIGIITESDFVRRVAEA